MKSNIVNELKYSIFFLLTMVFVVSCGNRSHYEEEHSESEVANQFVDQDSLEHDHSEDLLYACPMHPEIMGHEGDKCSKCGMFLTLAEADQDVEHSDDEHDEDHDHDQH